jgi:dipeptidyl aminopeptidase/acylaminoacyl peptidase
MKKVISITVIIGLIVGGIAAFLFSKTFSSKTVSLPLPVNPTQNPRPLEKYALENLRNTQIVPSEITIGNTLDNDNVDIEARMFYYYVDGKKVSGRLVYPKTPGTYPIVIQFRGYVDKETYKTGTGTNRSADYLAKNGFISLAPDFLGYGESDKPSGNVIEERFQTYATALTLLGSLEKLGKAFTQADINDISADISRVGLWGHSNGGHIAIVTLELTGKEYPTALWAPVTKPFPYAILYYTDEFSDRGKFLRKEVAKFEEDYDVDKYSLTEYLDWVNAPIQLHQGTADDAVPIKWSDQFVEKLKELSKDIDYYTYPGDDHNFVKGNWGTVVKRNIEFYKEKFK